MAKSLSATVSAGITFNFTNSLTGSITVSAPAGFSYSQSLTNGTGAANTADLVYAVQSTLAGAANTTIDLAGSVTDFFGSTITMARVKYLLIKHTNDTTATSITVGNGTNALALFNAATATHSIRNNGVFLVGCADATGIAVSAGTTDELKLLNADGTNTATYQVSIIGSST